jgi:hypothetical protein
MGYRGEDAFRARADSRRQPPWQSSSGAGPGAAGSWDDDSWGYGQDEEYAAADGYRDYAQNDSHARHDAYGQGDEYGQPEKYGYGQPGEYGRHAGYEDGGGYHDGYSGGTSYGEAPGYGQSDDYGYPRGGGHEAGDGYAADSGYAPGNGYPRNGGYTQGDGYSNDEYAHGHGYPLGDGYRTGGYAQSGDYPARPSGNTWSGDYPARPSGNTWSGDYPAQPSGNTWSGDYPAQPGRHARSGGYLALPSGSSHSGDYPVQGTAPAGRADLPGRYAGSDWYGGQPEAASGSGFADTGTYTMDARTIDSYGTGPRAAEYGTSQYDQDAHEPNGYQLDAHRADYAGAAPAQLAIRGFPPSPAALPAGPEAAAPEGLVYTGQQERYDDQYEPYPGYDDQDEFDGRRGYRAGHADEAPRGYDDYDEPAGFGAPGYDPADGPGLPGGYDDYADDGDPYHDRYGDGTGPRPAPAETRKGKASRGRGKRRLLVVAMAVVAVGVLGAAAYVFVPKSKPSAGGSLATTGPLPTAGSTSAATASCVKQFGEYCHIEMRTDDPAPLTLDEVFPPQFLNETDHASFARVATRLDKKCSNAVFGQDLINALQSGKCTQVLRASYVSGDSKIMGTIGVVNLATTNEAHYAGKLNGGNDFITPLSTSKGIASKLGKGTGVVEAEFKGHYLILTWAEFTSTNAPKTKAQDQQLQQFENDLVAGTANITLSERMVSGKPATAGAAG